MPPKGNPKNPVNKPKPPGLSNPKGGEEADESSEAELKFDQEVLWCMSQFEKLVDSGKLPDAKHREMIKAISALRKPNIPKVQKIQLMNQYFKNYKSKMQEEAIRSQPNNVVFQPAEDSKTSNGLFLKKKTGKASESSDFKFNFNSSNINEELAEANVKLRTLELK